MNTAVDECCSTITVEVEMNSIVHECSSAITVELETNAEQSTHKLPAV